MSSSHNTTDTKTHSPISVAMATYNGEKYLEQQLNSIFSQTVPVAEIIVCDDGSTDRTIDILESYSKTSPLTYYQNEKKLGVAANFKKAVSLCAKDNYIAFSDQDDIWVPDKIANALAKLSEIEDGSTPALVYSDAVITDEAGSVLNDSLFNELGTDKFKHCLSTLLFGNFVLGCTMVINKSMRDHVAAIPDDVPLNHDAWLALIGFSFGNACFLPNAGVLYRKHGDNASFTKYTKRNKAQRLLDHFLNLFRETDFLTDQIALVKAFYTFYQDQLSLEQQNKFRHVYMLENTSYLKKKIAFELAFKDYWIFR